MQHTATRAPKAKPEPVIVRIYPGEEHNPLLCFPLEPADYRGDLCNSWQPIGQHGACCPRGVTRPKRPGSWAAVTRPASREEAEKALAEYRRTYPEHVHPAGGYFIAQRFNRRWEDARRRSALGLRALAEKRAGR